MLEGKGFPLLRGKEAQSLVKPMPDFPTMDGLEGIPSRLCRFRDPVQGKVMPARAPCMVPGQVGENPEKPGSDPVRLSAGGEFLVSRNQRPLNQIRSFVLAPHHSDGVVVQNPPIPANEEPESVPVAGEDVPNHLGISSLDRTDHL